MDTSQCDEKWQQLDVPQLELLVLPRHESNTNDVTCQQNLDYSPLLKPSSLDVLLVSFPASSTNQEVERIQGKYSKLCCGDKVLIVEHALADDLPIHRVLICDSGRSITIINQFDLAEVFFPARVSALETEQFGHSVVHEGQC